MPYDIVYSTYPQGQGRPTTHRARIEDREEARQFARLRYDEGVEFLAIYQGPKLLLYRGPESDRGSF